MKTRNNPRQKIENQADQGASPLRELLLSELADIYSAEKQLSKALPRLAKAASAEELRATFESYLQETEGHIASLEQVADSIGEELEKKTCKAMQGLIEEGEEMMKEFKNSPALDAALVVAAQKVKHYEIASYGALAEWCRQLGFDDSVTILDETLAEEKRADEKLTEIAETLANQEAS